MQDTPIPKLPRLAITKPQIRTYINDVFKYNKRQKHDGEGSSHSSSSLGLFEPQDPNATKKCDLDSLFDR